MEFSVAMDIAEKYFSDGPELSTNHSQLALAYRGQKNFPSAEKHFLSAISSAEQVLGKDDLRVSYLLGQLGGVYRDTKRCLDAVEVDERSLVVAEEALSPGSYETGVALNNLSLDYTCLEQHEKAAELNKRARPLLDLRPDHDQLLLTERPTVTQESRKIWRKDWEYRKWANKLNDTAQEYRKRKEYDKSEAAFMESMLIRKRYLGLEHPDVGWSHNNLGHLYNESGRYEDAEREILMALEIWKKSVGPNHKNIGTGLNNLATVRDSQGRYKESLDLYGQALPILLENYGPEHPWVLTAQDGYDRMLDKVNENRLCV
jgi:tetratricopeptide (TPR) repeat protein